MTPTEHSAPTPPAPVLWPGLVITGAAIVVALVIAELIAAVSALTVAVVLGIVVGNVVRLPESAGPGLAWAMRRLLRAGVVLLGLRLAVGQLVGLGIGTIAAVLILVTVTFLGTVGLGRLLGASRGLSMLVATGFSVCGASAIAAMDGVIDRDDEDVATSIAMVTIFGTAAMLVLPVVGTGLGLSDPQLGRIAGGSVHEVAQVVAAASPAGAAAVAVAVVVKLSRVVLLAPLVMLVSLAERRRTGATGERPPVLPLFVVGFLTAVAVRSTGLLPEVVLAGAEQVTTLLLAGALFGLGTSVRVRALLRTGPKAFVLGLCSTVLVTATTVATMFTLA
ncbi:putative integral membrane protein (TIGR00698 family) [Saccharopolyspora lacisalsi]|uniref:Putative integral membrane protein (TIGR00698 family) n=1 Tax=Halosaccharopolyspora lacisalsi TaxID=1000566 RepID=A0A839DWN6_9PSEU|nr:putative sulfate exporter family transporter [Halosaccharopolyspora lacisalsi]MBA8824646.1 putative integral membrane protein (TIGR00698 family) [Halosaccharopolyspora lacisalsi]